jgi:hypothetical protein
LFKAQWFLAGRSPPDAAHFGLDQPPARSPWMMAICAVVSFPHSSPLRPALLSRWVPDNL